MNSNTPLAASANSSSATAAAARNNRRRLRLLADIAQPVGALIIFVMLWELICRMFQVPAYLVPAPSAIWTDTLKLIGPVAVHTLATTQTVLLGLSFYARRWIGTRRWRSVHRFTLLAWWLGVIHSLGEGTDAGQTWFLAMTAVAVVPAVVLFVARLSGLGSRSPKGRGASSAATSYSR